MTPESEELKFWLTVPTFKEHPGVSSNISFSDIPGLCTLVSFHNRACVFLQKKTWNRVFLGFRHGTRFPKSVRATFITFFATVSQILALRQKYYCWRSEDFCTKNEYIHVTEVFLPLTEPLNANSVSVQGIFAEANNWWTTSWIP